MPLFFKAEWSTSANYSRLFVVVNDLAQVADAGTFGNQRPYRNATTSSTGTATLTGVPIPGVTGTDPDGTADDKDGKGGASNKGDATSDPISGAGGGLSSGAIIGIAVACGILGLALIAALVWFLLRRRKQQKSMHPAGNFSAGSRREELMAEKEAHTDVDAAPHSPYSDDGAAAAAAAAAGTSRAANGSYHETPALTTDGATAASAGAPSSAHRSPQDQARSFTPYSDRPNTATTTSPGGAAGAAGAAAAAAAAAAAGSVIGTPSVRAASVAAPNDEATRAGGPSATPRALATPYAHLVEDGMTEDEIRRLEDEERQLDAAIEQAGRR
ncbi:hypothetical protein BT67DRAFT_139025 [Trichocladium antarcticum]|uniref:Uncharacterized protein n=1 Tax=Trichocladium antarcticum TaxID=1450529 RepID=A0AAN6UFG9_9PEZI|nr:hypothetical protein BT67DRAFT_139025 [Trichocladium antarcticum]